MEESGFPICISFPPVDTMTALFLCYPSNSAHVGELISRDPPSGYSRSELSLPMSYSRYLPPEIADDGIMHAIQQAMEGWDGQYSRKLNCLSRRLLTTYTTWTWTNMKGNSSKLLPFFRSLKVPCALLSRETGQVKVRKMTGTYNYFSGITEFNT